MADIKRLPGNGCRHHATERCLYGEHLNPGYTTEWRCRVLMRWEVAFDEFLERAELLNVGQAAVPDLWGRQFERMARDAFDCEEYVYAPEGEAPSCVHAFDGVCRLSLPKCEGRCRHFCLSTVED